MSNTWFYVCTWGLQLAGIALMHMSYRRRTKQLNAACRDLVEAHWYLIKAKNVLRDLDGFDARFTADQIEEHIASKWEAYGINEAGFRGFVRKLPKRHGGEAK